MRMMKKMVTDVSCFMFCRSLLAGVVQIEAIHELCKLLVVVSSETQKEILGMLLSDVANSSTLRAFSQSFQWL